MGKDIRIVFADKPTTIDIALQLQDAMTDSQESQLSERQKKKLKGTVNNLVRQLCNRLMITKRPHRHDDPTKSDLLAFFSKPDELDWFINEILILPLLNQFRPPSQKLTPRHNKLHKGITCRRPACHLRSATKYKACM